MRAFLRTWSINAKRSSLIVPPIRLVIFAAQLVETEDVGKTFATRGPSTPKLTDENERRWLSLDLLRAGSTPLILGEQFFKGTGSNNRIWSCSRTEKLRLTSLASITTSRVNGTG